MWMFRDNPDTIGGGRVMPCQSCLRNLLAKALFAVLHAAVQKLSKTGRIQILIPRAPRAWSHARYGPGSSEVIASVSDSSLDNCYGGLWSVRSWS